MSIPCQRLGCKETATHAIKLCVPGVGDPEAAPARGAMLIGLVVCEHHIDEADAAPFFECNGETLRPLLTVMMAGGPPPDFDRAYVSGVSMESEEYRDMLLHGMAAGKPN